jgi:hypothetical protein
MQQTTEQMLEWVAKELPLLKKRVDNTRAAIERTRRTLTNA